MAIHAVGSEALFNNTIGYGNTATGYQKQLKPTTRPPGI